MEREIRIVMQNSMAHAVQIAIANKKDGKDISVEEVVKNAELILGHIFNSSAKLAEHMKPKDSIRKPGTAR